MLHVATLVQAAVGPELFTLRTVIHKVVDNLVKGTEAASDSNPICPNEWSKARATGALTCKSMQCLGASRI